MSSFDAKALVTREGVTIVVKGERPPEPPREPERRDPIPREVVVPPIDRAGDRDPVLRRLCDEHGDFVEGILRAQGIIPESAKDLRQVVLEALCAHIKDHGPIENERAFLRRVARNKVVDHARLWRPDVEPGADVEQELLDEPDPEGTAELRERVQKLGRAIARLPPNEAEVVRCVCLLELTFEKTAKAVGRPLGTVITEHARAMKKLKEMAREPER